MQHPSTMYRCMLSKVGSFAGRILHFAGGELASSNLKEVSGYKRRPVRDRLRT